MDEYLAKKSLSRSACKLGYSCNESLPKVLSCVKCPPFCVNKRIAWSVWGTAL